MGWRDRSIDPRRTFRMHQIFVCIWIWETSLKWSVTKLDRIGSARPLVSAGRDVKIWEQLRVDSTYKTHSLDSLGGLTPKYEIRSPSITAFRLLWGNRRFDQLIRVFMLTRVRSVFWWLYITDFSWINTMLNAMGGNKRKMFTIRATDAPQEIVYNKGRRSP